MEASGTTGSQRRRYVYEPPWPAYALAWAPRLEPRCRLAIGSYTEQETNKVQIVELGEETKKLEVVAEAEHPFPPTKLMWRPDGSQQDLLASSSTTLNLWKMEEGQLKHVDTLANHRTQHRRDPPITSFDWSSSNDHKLGISSVDTTCTIWNLEKRKMETQLIAHDKAVYDIAFAHNHSLFTSVGADGSVRLFDQRDLEHSTIIYETSPPSPLLRVAWNKLNQNHIATIALDTIGVILIDIRRPAVALRALSHHKSCVNTISWAPHSWNHMLCGTSDGTALIWDVKEMTVTPADGSGAAAGQPVPDAASQPTAPLLAYECDHEVYQVQWPSTEPEYVALGCAQQVEVLQI